MRKITYAFIDSQNLNLGVRGAGWKLDFGKFRRFLQDTHRVNKAFLFIGYMPGNQRLYTSLRDSGYNLVFKPTQHYYKDGKLTTKGNVDAELVLYSAAKLSSQYDKAVIVSGDGDFLCLYEYLEQKGKLSKILVPNKYQYSRLLKRFSSKIDFISTKADRLAK